MEVELTERTLGGSFFFLRGDETSESLAQSFSVLDDYVFVAEDFQGPCYQINVRKYDPKTSSFHLDISVGHVSWLIKRTSTDVLSLHKALRAAFPELLGENVSVFTTSSLQPTEALDDAARSELQSYLRSICTNCGSDSGLANFFAESAKDKKLVSKMSPADRLPARVWEIVMSHLHPAQIIKLARCSKALRTASNNDQLWQKKGFFSTSPSGTLFVSPEVIFGPPLFSWLYHGDLDSAAEISPYFQFVKYSNGDAATSRSVARLGHSIVNLQLTQYLHEAQEKTHDGRIVVCSEMGDEESQLKGRPEMPSVVLDLKSGGPIERATALATLFKAVIKRANSDVAEPYGVADYIGVLQVAARATSSAVVFLPFKVGPAAIFFTFVAGYGMPMSVLGLSSQCGSLALRAIWSYPTCVVAGGAVWGALISTPCVGRIHQSPWVKWCRTLRLL